MTHVHYEPPTFRTISKTAGRRKMSCISPPPPCPCPSEKQNEHLRPMSHAHHAHPPSLPSRLPKITETRNGNLTSQPCRWSETGELKLDQDPCPKTLFKPKGMNDRSETRRLIPLPPQRNLVRSRSVLASSALFRAGNTVIQESGSCIPWKMGKKKARQRYLTIPT